MASFCITLTIQMNGLGLAEFESHQPDHFPGIASRAKNPVKRGLQDYSMAAR